MFGLFRRKEQRGFTEIRSDAAFAAASTGKVDVGETAAAAAAAGVIGRAFGAATVAPSVERTGLTSAILQDIGASLILSGESVWLLDVRGGTVRLTRAASWQISGGNNPDTWRYKLAMTGPDRMTEVSVPGDGVLHPRILSRASQPHKGRSPLDLAGISATALANAERQLSEELSGSVGRLIPYPSESVSGDSIDQLEADLIALKGRSALVPSMSRQWEGTGGGQGDWRNVRIGADPPASVVQLRQDYQNALLAAAGIPPQLLSANGDSAASREAYRQALHMTIKPYANAVITEAREKLSAPVELTFEELSAADIQGRARSFKSFVDGGLHPLDAAREVGITVTQPTTTPRSQGSGNQ